MTRAQAEESVRRSNGILYQGTVVRFDDRGVVIRDKNGKEEEIPTEEIVELNLGLSVAQGRADVALANGDFTQAAELFLQAAQGESRPWALRRIEIGLLDALRLSGQHLEAAELFLEIAAERDDPAFMARAPLVWIDGTTIDEKALEQARQWLAPTASPMQRLLGASWLVDGARSASAREALDKLRTQPDRRIGSMARAQYLRASANPPSDEELRQFHDLIETLPTAARKGPQFVYAQALEANGKPVDAALAYLWVPMVYDQERSELAAASLYHAARNSKKAGLNADATRLLDELAKKYPESPWAARAERANHGSDDPRDIDGDGSSSGG
ncbi:hypothetical protein [Planctomycetes bacterium Pan216]